ncbi:Ig-like domain-containing protein [bacterium]|nr:Ig-like domain-containing protein [bacterium]
MKKYGILFTLLIGISAVFITAQFWACSEDDDDDEYFPPPHPPIEIIIEFYSVNGEYSLPADNSSTLELEAKVTDQHGNPYSLVRIEFSTDLGTLTPTSATTDNQGLARTVLQAGCFPGGGCVTAYTIGRLAYLQINYYGDSPEIKIEIQAENNASAGTYSPVHIKAWLNCSGVPATDFSLDFSSESGCFVDGCNPRLSTTTGVIETDWIPSFRLAEDQEWYDYNQILSNVIRVNLVQNDIAIEDIFAFAELYLYPVHIDLGFSDYSGLGNTFCFWVHPFGYDGTGFYPLTGIPFNFHASCTQGTVWFDEDQNDSGTCVHWTGDQGQIDIIVTMDYSGPGDCCEDRPDLIHWERHIRLTIDYQYWTAELL